MIIVTGASGFIGSNLVRTLNQMSETDILIVDSLEHDTFRNLSDCTIADYMGIDSFFNYISSGNTFPKCSAIYHVGACADTMETSGEYMMYRNFTFSKTLLEYAVKYAVPFVYSSSASVYGINHKSEEVPQNERPINLYAWSKLAFDQHVRSKLNYINSTVVGLRYFNVYGAGEWHKGRMQSMVCQLYNMAKKSDTVTLFGEYDGFGAGCQARDFVHVSDCVSVNLFMANSDSVRTGIFNVGTGTARTFNDAAKVVGAKSIEYKPFPDVLKGKYQPYTCADLTRLRNAGYTKSFLSLEEGVRLSRELWDREAEWK